MMKYQTYFPRGWEWEKDILSPVLLYILLLGGIKKIPSRRYQGISVKCIKSQKDRLLLLLSRFSHVRLCATPQTAAHQAPLSLGFSRQEHWSGLPFPSPRHESEKWKWSHSVVFQLLVTPWTGAHQAPPSMGFSRQEYWSGVPLPSPKDRINFLYSQILLWNFLKWQ